MTSNDRLGGYRTTGIKLHQGRDGAAFTAVVTRADTPVLRVGNEGSGGCDFYQPLGPSRPSGAFLVELAALEEFAQQWNAGNKFAGIEDTDSFVAHLLAANLLDRQKRIPFVFAGEDYFATGEFHQFRGQMSREEVIGALTRPRFASRNPRVWDREAGRFVAV